MRRHGGAEKSFTLLGVLLVLLLDLIRCHWHPLESNCHVVAPTNFHRIS
jgi:hypothetical protein